MNELTMQEIDEVYRKCRTVWKNPQFENWDEEEVLNLLLRHNVNASKFKDEFPVCWNFVKRKKFTTKDIKKWKMMTKLITENKEGNLPDSELYTQVIQKLKQKSRK